MRAVEVSLDSGPVSTPRGYESLAGRFVQNYNGGQAAASAAPVANMDNSQNGQYPGTGSQASTGSQGSQSWQGSQGSQSWQGSQAPRFHRLHRGSQGSQGAWGQSWGGAQSPSQNVGGQALGASTVLQQVATENTGQYTWKPNGEATQLQTSTQSGATSSLSQSTTTSQLRTTSQTSSTTSQATSTTSGTTTTQSQSTSTNTQPTTLETRVSHTATATATDGAHEVAATSTGTAHHGVTKLDTSAYAAVAVCAGVGIIAAFVLFSLYRKRRRAKAIARAKELRRRHGGPKPGQLEANSSVNTLPQLFLASKTALFSVVSLRSSNEKDDFGSDRGPAEKQIPLSAPPQYGKSQLSAVSVPRSAGSQSDSGSISDASTVAGTPSRHPTFRQPTELHYDTCSTSDHPSDDGASEHRPGLYRRLTERVASIRTRSKQPKRGHRHCLSAPNEIITNRFASPIVRPVHEIDHDRHNTSDDDTDQSTRSQPHGIQITENQNESRSTSDDEADNSTETPNDSRSTSGDGGDHNASFERPPLKTRGSFKERVTGLAKLPRMPSINSLYKASAASSIEEKDRPGAKLSTIPDDEMEDNRLVTSYAPSTFKTYSVDMEFSPVNDTQIKLALGQSVIIYQVYDHGWVHCLNRDTGQDGLAPRACLSIWPTNRPPSNRAVSDVTLYPPQMNVSVTSLGSSRPMSPITRFYSHRCPSSPAI
ncbi:hypothetical protein ANOM_000483 [Aspergillus nomiae NRRL 13137]|uniref:SH3 domain-containing protein n=1 Tax=Aspergillus nomiae NRRL (strain ATCC 15546 / NRRL 13137 / CBS 260.88 / M93) TaxID=1509407 RepID=A0A0L1JI20_ASPN3|nr:uncharacterized protein ANOM_000483 [Aspergillus nomiae NRRL 13137]KNG91406.1 hypothetical protein ANOM_000483 [Aspergillus nomiae NRRL 13137]